MIDKVFGAFYLTCDICDYQEGPFDEFYDALNFKQNEGWKSQKDNNNVWQHVCPECLEEGN